MNALLDFVRRHPLPLFFASTFVISWGGILLVVGGPAGFTGAAARTDPRFPLVYIAMLAGPTVSGLLFTWMVDGPSRLRAIGSDLLRWPANLSAYAFAVLAAPLAIVVSIAVLSLGLPQLTFQSVLFGLAVGLGAGFFEELGWTAFATVHLRQRYGILKTGIILGVVWAAWHVLAVVWGLGSMAGSVPIAAFVAADLLTGLPAYRVFMVWRQDRTGSLPLAMLTHASLTAALLILGPAGLAGAAQLAYDFTFAAVLWVFVTVLLTRRQAAVA